MPVPSAITDLSQTAGSNSPAGSEAPTTADDYFRAHASFLAQLRDGKNFADPVTLASAATTDIGGQNSLAVEITGTTTITSFGTTYNGPRFLRFTGALTITHNATSLNLPGSANITTAAGDTAIAIPNSTPNGWNVVSYQKKSLAPGAADSATNATNLNGSGTISSTTTATTQAAGTNNTSVATTAFVQNAIALRGYIDGLTLSTAGSSTTMTIGAGTCVDNTGTIVISRTTSIAKTTSAWAVGTGNGGLDTGAIANSTWYYFYAIRRPDTGVVDVVFSTNSSTPTLPTNYTQYRYIGAGLTNGSAQWTKFVQIGNEFYWDTPVLDFSAAGSTTAALLTCSVPSGRKMKALLSANLWIGGSADGAIYISDPDVSNLAPSMSAAPLASLAIYGSLAGDRAGAQISCWTNTSAQVRHRELTTSTVYIATLGWKDNRGKDA